MTVAVWLLAAVLSLGYGAQVGATVVCVGADGHIDIESSIDDCCTPAPADGQRDGVKTAWSASSCGDCVDVQLKAPPFNPKKDRLSRIDLDCGRPLCESLSCRGCGRNSIDPSSRLDQHSRLLVSLSTVVLLT
jgi:hypothetical protein